MLSSRLLLLLALLCAPATAHEQLDVRIADMDRALLDVSSRTAKMRVQRAELLRRARRYSAALQDLQLVKSHWPQTEGLEPTLARVFIDLGSHGLAIERLDRILQQDPLDANALLLRSACHEALGRMTLALADLDKCATAGARPDPQLQLERVRLAWLVDPTGRAATKRLHEALASMGRLPVLVVAAIEQALRCEQADEAVRQLDLMLESLSRKEGWLLRKAEVLAQAGRIESARQSLRASRLACQQLAPKQRATGAMRALAARQRTLEAELHRLTTIHESTPIRDPEHEASARAHTPAAHSAPSRTRGSNR
ncbi:MAG: tetratricopeptide (TPR) repeat protein [Planctomycetota bacterium]|jgi:tetratricopeptide (TPR) repeat protein